MRPVTKSEVPIGMILSGRYRVAREIGRGGMAAVYEAEHVDIGKRVAVKILDSSLARNDTVIERFNREARAAASVDSTNICEVFDVGRLDDGRPYMVMELLEGESLYERMVSEGQLKIADTVRIISQVGRGLARAHAAGIVHRDLKPENIFLHRNGEGEENAKIVDFGLAKFHAPLSGSQERLTREGAIFGTPLYMSPEQVSGQGHADHRSDLWALGCIVYECLTGRPIWPVDRGMAYIFAQIVNEPIPVPSSLRPDLPRAFDAWFNHALDRDPAKRYQSAQQMVVEMATALGHDAAGLVSAPVLLPEFPADSSPVVVHGAQDGAPVVVEPSRPLASTHEQGDALASTEPPPFSAHGPTEPPPLPPMPPLPSVAGADLQRSDGTRLRVVAGVAAVAVLAVVAAAGWIVFGPSPPREDDSEGTTGSLSAPRSAASAAVSSPAAAVSVASLPAFAEAVRGSQQLIAKGRAPAAVALLERAVERSDHPALLTMLDQARIAAAATGPCSVRAFGRPRAYDNELPARSASVLATPQGALVSWTSGAAGTRHAHVVPLDHDLQASAPPVEVSPESGTVTATALVHADAGPALLFVQSEGERRGPSLQPLTPGAETRGESVRIGIHQGARGEPSATRTPKGLLVAYGNRASGRNLDVFLRLFSASALSEPVRVTRHGSPDDGDGRDAAAPRVALAGDRVMLAYIRQTLRENEVVLHQAGSLQDLAAGKARTTPGEQGEPEAVVVTQNTLKVHSPSLACNEDTCFVAWRNQPSGSHIAAVDPSSGEMLWRKTFASAGTDVTVASHPSGASLMVWFDRGRVRGAPLGREGMGDTSVLARVHGEQAPPSLVAAEQAGTWLTAWTCFEGGQPEVFVARLRCGE